MDFLGWSLLVVVSLWATVHAFYWGLKSGQFAEPERARYLALPDDLPEPPAEMPASRGLVGWCLMGISLLVLASGAAALVLSLWHSRG